MIPNEVLQARIEALRARLPADRQSLALVSLLDEAPPEGACLTCGEAVKAGDEIRCALCADAIWFLLFETERPERVRKKPKMSTRELNENDD